MKRFSHRAIAEKILKNKNAILLGKVLSVDPASHTMGYALYDGTEEIACGTLKAKPRDDIGQRLHDLQDQLDDVLKYHHPIDVCLIELERSDTGNVYLVWSCGPFAASANAPVTLEIPHALWKRVIDDDYYKSDVMDAKYIFKLAQTICEEDDEEEESQED